MLRFDGATDQYHALQGLYDQWGVWLIIVKGATPIPYKLVTIISGAFRFDLTTFTAIPCSEFPNPATLMSAYYFHIRDNGVLINDPDGLELPDLDAVRAECKRVVVSVLEEEQMDDQRSANREFQIEDETGRIVLVVPFRSAVSRVRTARG